MSDPIDLVCLSDAPSLGYLERSNWGPESPGSLNPACTLRAKETGCILPVVGIVRRDHIFIVDEFGAAYADTQCR